ncbi:hypothetical protein H8D36_03850 [archaeon]|nr:hypothetical protein [archaeon]
MKTKAILFSLVAIFAVFLVSVVSAASLADISSVTFNDVVVSDGTANVAGMAGDVVPLRVTFEALDNSSDVRIEARIYSGRNSYSDSTSRFNIIENNVYTKLLSLQLPTDLKDVTKDLRLVVEIYNAETGDEFEYTVKMQRESYEFDILSVDHNMVVAADDIMAVSVVVKNTGFERADDGFVTVSIPELGISAKGYLGDLIPAEDYTDYDNEEDSVQKVLYLRIPSDAKSGVYDVSVKAYNSDSATVVNGAIKVVGSDESNAISADDREDASEVSISVVIWTIVLVVIFLVLLAILVSLLMKKDKPIEEVETSYY